MRIWKVIDVCLHEHFLIKRQMIISQTSVCLYFWYYDVHRSVTVFAEPLTDKIRGIEQKQVIIYISISNILTSKTLSDICTCSFLLDYENRHKPNFSLDEPKNLTWESRKFLWPCREKHCPKCKRKRRPKVKVHNMIQCTLLLF